MEPLPVIVGALAALVVVLGEGRRDGRPWGVAGCVVAAAVIAHPAAYAGLAAALGGVAVGAHTRTGQAWLGAAAAAALVAGAALSAGFADVGLVASFAALGLTVGVMPLHVGVAALAERHPARLVELAGTSLLALFLHLRFAEPASPSLAYDLAVGVVAWGAGAATLGALVALAQRSLRGLLATTFTMHGGMLLAAAGAAGRGHLVGAVFVGVTLALALGGFAAAVVAVEARVGPVQLTRPGGRGARHPALAASFAFFAAAGIALPGTAGFVADDLLLHALWSESPVACGFVVAASATLAIALLKGFSAVFLGLPGPELLAPDLDRVERVVAIGLIGLLVAAGLVPELLIAPSIAFLGP